MSSATPSIRSRLTGTMTPQVIAKRSGSQTRPAKDRPSGALVSSFSLTNHTAPARRTVAAALCTADPDTARATKELLADAAGRTLAEQAAAERSSQAELQAKRGKNGGW